MIMKSCTTIAAALLIGSSSFANTSQTAKLLPLNGPFVSCLDDCLTTGTELAVCAAWPTASELRHAVEITSVSASFFVQANAPVSDDGGICPTSGTKLYLDGDAEVPSRSLYGLAVDEVPKIGIVDPGTVDRLYYCELRVFLQRLLREEYTPPEFTSHVLTITRWRPSDPAWSVDIIMSRWEAAGMRFQVVDMEDRVALTVASSTASCDLVTSPEGYICTVAKQIFDVEDTSTFTACDCSTESVTCVKCGIRAPMLSNGESFPKGHLWKGGIVGKVDGAVAWFCIEREVQDSSSRAFHSPLRRFRERISVSGRDSPFWVPELDVQCTPSGSMTKY